MDSSSSGSSEILKKKLNILAEIVTNLNPIDLNPSNICSAIVSQKYLNLRKEQIVNDLKIDIEKIKEKRIGCEEMSKSIKAKTLETEEKIKLYNKDKDPREFRELRHRIGSYKIEIDAEQESFDELGMVESLTINNGKKIQDTMAEISELKEKENQLKKDLLFPDELPLGSVSELRMYIKSRRQYLNAVIDKIEEIEYS